MSSSSKPIKDMYIFRQGYCSKGDYCEFSHSLSDTVCKNYIAGFCKYGDSCNFQHIHDNSKSSIITPVFSQIKACNDFNSVDDIRIETLTLCSNIKTDTNIKKNNIQSIDSELENLWGLESESEQNVYFYGAAGKSEITKNKSPTKNDNQTIKSYANIVKLTNNMTLDETDNNATKFTSNNQKTTIYKFYILGDCRFGSACKNLHEDDELLITNSSLQQLVVNGTNMSNNENQQHPEICGICMGIPSNGVYGILNNCNCTFCLSCVREWRREGNLVTKSLEQVRLCPLCRRQSHFVAPSTKPMVGDQKDTFIPVYKERMASKPCKV